MWRWWWWCQREKLQSDINVVLKYKTLPAGCPACSMQGLAKLNNRAYAVVSFRTLSSSPKEEKKVPMLNKDDLTVPSTVYLWYVGVQSTPKLQCESGGDQLHHSQDKSGVGSANAPEGTAAPMEWERDAVAW